MRLLYINTQYTILTFYLFIMSSHKKEIKKSDLTLINNSFAILESAANYVNCQRMYLGYFNKIPNFISIDYIDDKSFKKWFDKEYESKIIKQHYRQDYNIRKKELESLDHFYFLENEILINLEFDSIYILFSEEQLSTVQILFEQFKKFIKTPKKTTDISLIYSRNGELDTKELHIKKPKINFDIHYNENFYPIHNEIVKRINKKDINGLYLFHGEPGTGKSTYIKYLIYQLKKKVIFISPKMAGELDNINMTSFLLNNRNSVLVIEDAEELIASREEIRNSNLSMLLNLTDGLLGESLGIQIIATFNTDITNIDKALLRKGRLTTIYEFAKLSIERTNTLLNILGHKEKVNQPLAVTDIFNFNSDNNYIPKQKKLVGFGK